MMAVGDGFGGMRLRVVIHRWLRLPRKLIQIHISPGDDDAGFFAFHIHFPVHNRRNRNGTGGFYDDFHPLPNVSHIPDDRLLGYGNDIFDVILYDRERKAPE